MASYLSVSLLGTCEMRLTVLRANIDIILRIGFDGNFKMDFGSTLKNLSREEKARPCFVVVVTTKL